MNAKDIELITRLRDNGNHGVSLMSLIERATRDTRDMEKFDQRLDNREGGNADATLVAKILLRASMLTPRSVFAILNVVENDLPPVERNFCTTVKAWCFGHLEADVMRIDASTNKRSRDDVEEVEEVPEPPADFTITDEQLDLLREELRQCETEFRNLLKEELTQVENTAAAMKIYGLVPPRERYNAIILAGVHEAVPGETLRKTVKYLGHVYGFHLDTDMFDSLLEGGRERLRLRKNPYTSVVIPLISPQDAMYGGSLFLSDNETLTPPGAFIFKDVPRPRVQGEQYGLGN